MVLKAKKVRRVRKATRVTQELKVPEAKLALREKEEVPDPREHREPKVRRATRVKPEPKVRRVRKAIPYPSMI